MDLGAHFYCCDFQAHSPRDKNWKGKCPASEAERRDFSTAFVKACREKGIQAVAITDHHDLAFFPYIRDAARSETDLQGAALADAQRLVVFPGLELTLAVPCQALLIFDPETDPQSLSGAMAALGIEPAGPGDPKTKEVTKLRFTSLEEVCEVLGALASIRDRFILLPNVNDGGSDTILRRDFTEHYKSMPCVGGYVDGDYTGHSRKSILDGHDTAWGNRSIGVIQTSDSREADFSRLGTSTTWIKWSAPTTEAIRQACLSPASRICYSKPLVPDNWISKIEVSDCKFFGPLTVEMNPQLNTIIGGRGTGKSTILEYLRWALCDQPYVHSGETDTELPNYEQRRRSLVSATLGYSQGAVTVHYLRHEVPHRIRREGGTNRVFLKVANQEERETTEELIQSLAQIQGYSQKQLSHVSVRTQELERLLTTPIAQELSNIDAQIRSHGSALRQAFEKSESKRNLEEQLQAAELDLTSKKEQRNTLTQEVKDLPDEQRAAIDHHPFFSEGQRLAAAYSAAIEGTSSAIRTSEQAVGKIVSELGQVGSAKPVEELTAIREKIVNGIQAISARLKGVSDFVTDLQNSLKEDFKSAELKLVAHNTVYEAAASENRVVQERLDSLRALSEQISKVETDRASLARGIDQIGDPEKALLEARNAWLDMIGIKNKLLETQATRLDADSGGQLRVRIGPPQNTEALRAAIQNSIAGAAITRTEKIQELVGQIVADPEPVIAWNEMGIEMVALARTGPRLDSGAALPPTPRLTRASLTEGELGRIARRLRPNAAFELTLLYPQRVPVFEYRTPQGTYAPFEDASPGQQATALIGLLLNQSAGSLVVDQPEDDLDNLTIMEVAARLWQAKEKRQIIFSTHNPNLVVIGDAELVLHCAYDQQGQARLNVADQGAIDNRDVCEVITRVMEGGEEAFFLRKEKYGF